LRAGETPGPSFKVIDIPTDSEGNSVTPSLTINRSLATAATATTSPSSVAPTEIIDLTCDSEDENKENIPPLFPTNYVKGKVITMKIHMV